MVCEVRPFGVAIVSTYEVTPIEGGARLHHAMACTGALERGYRLLSRQYTKLLARETRDLANLVRQDVQIAQTITDSVTMSERSSTRMAP